MTRTILATLLGIAALGAAFGTAPRHGIAPTADVPCARATATGGPQDAYGLAERRQRPRYA